MPCRMRSTTSKIGPSVPACAAVGRRPMRKVAVPIRLTVTRNAPLRPRRSPMTPKISAPSGRNAKPAANSASAASRAGVGASPEKKTLEMTGARLPKMKKSYHSNAVPADEAITTRAIDQGLWCGCSATVAMCFPLETRDSSAAASVQLANGAVDAGELEAELSRVHVVGECSSVGLQLHLLHHAETALHHVADCRTVAAHHDVDRPNRVAE